MLAPALVPQEIKLQSDLLSVCLVENYPGVVVVEEHASAKGALRRFDVLNRDQVEFKLSDPLTFLLLDLPGEELDRCKIKRHKLVVVRQVQSNRKRLALVRVGHAGQLDFFGIAAV